MINGLPVTFEHQDHGQVPLDGLHDCYLSTFIGDSLFIRSEFRPLSLGDYPAAERMAFDRATLERHGIDTDTVEHWSDNDRMWEYLFVSPPPNPEKQMMILDPKSTQFSIDVTDAWLIGHADKRGIDPMILQSIHRLVGVARVYLATLPKGEPHWTVRVWMDGTECVEVRTWYHTAEAWADADAAIRRGARKVEIETPQAASKP